MHYLANKYNTCHNFLKTSYATYVTTMTTKQWVTRPIVCSSRSRCVVTATTSTAACSRYSECNWMYLSESEVMSGMTPRTGSRPTDTDRQTDIQTNRQTHRQTDRQTHRQTDRHTYRRTDRHTDRQTVSVTECICQSQTSCQVWHHALAADLQTQTNRQTDEQTDTQTNRQTDTQTHRQTDRHTDRHTDSECNWMYLSESDVMSGMTPCTGSRPTDTDRQTARRTDTQTDRQTYRQTDLQTNRQRQINRQRDIQSESKRETDCYLVPPCQQTLWQLEP